MALPSGQDFISHYFRSVTIKQLLIEKILSHHILIMVCFALDDLRIWRVSPLSSSELGFTPNNPFGRGYNDSKPLWKRVLEILTRGKSQARGDLNCPPP